LIWLILVLLTAAALAPAAWVLRGRTRLRDRTEAAMALHRAQLAELDRDLAEGRIGPAEHATALLEVQRRLLAAAETPDAALSRGPREPLALTLVVIPVVALCLYFVAGHPELPSAPSNRSAQAGQRAQEDADMINQLRAAIADATPGSDRAREGNVLLGNIQEAKGDFGAAAAAWRLALGIRFDPLLAAETAEAATRAEGRVSPESAGLFRRALAAAPADAPWRELAEQRLAESRAH